MDMNIKAECSIDAVYITDMNFASLTRQAIRSFLRFNSTSKVYVLVACGSPDECDKIISAVGLFQDCITYIDCHRYYEWAQTTRRLSANSHVPCAALLKFYLSRILPQELSRVLYLDGDTIVLSNLGELENLNLIGRFAGVVSDENIMRGEHDAYANRHPFKDETIDGIFTYDDFIHRNGGYFNSGVMLLNLDHLRRNRTNEKLVEFAQAHSTNIVDQDAFNYVFGGNVVWMSEKYNEFFYSCGQQRKIDEDVCILHLAGTNKKMPSVEQLWKMRFHSRRPTITIMMGINPAYDDAILAKRHLEHTAKQLNFLNPKTLLDTSISNLEDYQEFWLRRRNGLFDTDYVMTLEPDSMVVDETMWDDVFLHYDYIGAPWFGRKWAIRWRDGVLHTMNKMDNVHPDDILVGNSGFSITSKMLCDWVARFGGNRDNYCDKYLCGTLRQHAMDFGFTFAPFAVAKRFSVEKNNYANQFAAHKSMIKNGKKIDIRDFVRRSC